MKRIFALIALSYGTFCLSGCATLRQAGNEKVEAYAANRPDVQDLDVARYVKGQNETILSLSKLISGTDNWTPKSIPNSKEMDWSPLVQAGIQYADVRCERYLDALFWFNRAREATSRQINYTGAAAGATLALVEASKQLIGLTPLAFTLADQTINNIGKGLLFDLQPTTIKLLVAKEQNTFKAAVGKITYTNRISAIQAIQAYVNICLPSSIETQAIDAIGRAEFEKIEILVTKPADNVANDEEPQQTPPALTDLDESPESETSDELAGPSTTVTTTTTNTAADGSQTVSTVEKTVDTAPPPANSVPVIGQVQGSKRLSP